MFERNYYLEITKENEEEKIFFEKSTSNKNGLAINYLQKLEGRKFILSYQTEIGKTKIIEGCIDDVLENEIIEERLSKKDLIKLATFLYTCWG